MVVGLAGDARRPASGVNSPSPLVHDQGAIWAVKLCRSNVVASPGGGVERANVDGTCRVVCTAAR